MSFLRTPPPLRSFNGSFAPSSGAKLERVTPEVSACQAQIFFFFVLPHCFPGWGPAAGLSAGGGRFVCPAGRVGGRRGVGALGCGVVAGGQLGEGGEC